MLINKIVLNSTSTILKIVKMCEGGSVKLYASVASDWKIKCVHSSYVSVRL